MSDNELRTWADAHTKGVMLSSVALAVLRLFEVIVDIGMRMLKPRELGNAQGFPPEYILTGTATNQVERIGNSVCPPVARAIVKANVKLKRVAREMMAA